MNGDTHFISAQTNLPMCEIFIGDDTVVSLTENPRRVSCKTCLREMP